MISKRMRAPAALAMFCVLCGGALGADPADRPDKPPARDATYKGPKVELKVKFTPGSYVLTEKMSAPLKMKMTVDGRTQPMDMTVAMTVGGDVSISEADATGRQTVRFVCRTVRTDMSVFGAAMTYHSDGPAARQTPRLAAALKPLVGTAVTLTGKDGKWADVSKALHAVLSRIGNTPMRQQMKGTWGPFLQGMLTRHWAGMIPPAPVGPGDEWTATINLSSVPMLGKMVFEANCRLRDIRGTAQGEIAVIDYVVKAKLADRQVTPGPDGPPMTLTIKALAIHMAGSVEFNMDTGLGTRIDLKQDLTASMSAARGATNVAMDIAADVTYANTLVKTEGGGNQVAPAK